jgi:hypothetical protein
MITGVVKSIKAFLGLAPPVLEKGLWDISQLTFLGKNANLDL